MNRFEVVGTRAYGFSLDDIAYRVDPARSLARIHTPARLTDTQQRTVNVSVRAQTLFPAPLRVRVSDVTGRTPTDVPRRRVRFAHGGGMARGLVTHFGSFAGNFRERVRLETGRTLAQRLVPVGEAYGVGSARVFVARVYARMRLSVTDLRLRTVIVVHARHSLATARIVRTAGKRTGRTLALGDVVVRDTDGVQAAHGVVANGFARSQFVCRVF